jgi:phospholipid transport system substrate-binding protein
MKRFIALMLAVLLSAFPIFVRAEAVTPDALVKNTVHGVLAALKQEKDKKKIQALVDEKVLPLFDFTLMTKRAVGPAWKTATAEQKKVLIDEFRDLLVRVFIAKAFTDNADRTVKFEPGKYAEDDDQVTVKTLIISQGKESISVDYDLKKTTAGWKVVDLAIAGPRLALDIYSNQFREPMQQSGIDGLIQFLADKNHAAENAVAAAVRKVESK